MNDTVVAFGGHQRMASSEDYTFVHFDSLVMSKQPLGRSGGEEKMTAQNEMASYDDHHDR